MWLCASMIKVKVSSARPTGFDPAISALTGR
jgi:hypothetical protein